MHHGWILAGKSGLGKDDFAQAAARELVDQDGIAQPAGAHPDIITLTYGAKNDKEAKAQADGKKFELARSIRVDQVRAMQKRLTTRPTLGDRRVIIINPADDMEVSAANALLKSLEEPPQGTFFLLVTHRPARLLPTIRSRCRLLRFPLVTNSQLDAMLEASGAAGGSEARAAAIAASEGSYGAALRFAEQDLAPVAGLIAQLLSGKGEGSNAAATLAQMIGGRADRARLQAVMELAQAVTADHARRSANADQRASLIKAHCELVTLAAQAPNYNFDTGLLTLEIGSLLMRAGQASDHVHG